VKTAFELGINELKLGGSSDDNVPVLLTRDGVDAATVKLVSTPSG
jgi:hypothetical protein